MRREPLIALCALAACAGEPLPGPGPPPDPIVQVAAPEPPAPAPESPNADLTDPPPRVTLQDGGDVRAVLTLLAAYSGKAIIIAPEVQGHVLPEIKDMHWLEAMEKVASAAGDYVVLVEEGETLIRVVPRERAR